MRTRSFWTLNKLIVLLTAGGFIILLPEIRFDHSDVLAETWKAWIPLVYSTAMIVVTLLGLALWERGGRQLLLLGFIASIVVGALGFYFHNSKQPVARVLAMVDSLAQPVRKEEHHPAPTQSAGHVAGAARGKPSLGNGKAGGGNAARSEAAPERPQQHGLTPIVSRRGPPVLAPLSFLGLGLIGALACAARFQPERF